MLKEGSTSTGKGKSSKVTQCGFTHLNFLEWWWEEECPQQTLFFNSRMFFGDQLVCGVTAFAVPGLSAQREPRRTLFCTAVAPQKLSGRFATCPAGTQC